jgi:O-antigen ligase
VKRVPEYLLVLYTLTGTISIAVSQAVMGLGAVTAVVDRGRRTRIAWPVTRLEGPLMAWTAAALLATLFASNPLASAIKLKKTLLLAMVFWAPAVIRNRWGLGRLFMGLLFSAGVTSLYGVLTFFLQGGGELGTRIRGFHGFYLTNSGLLLLCTFPAALFATCPAIRPSHRWGAAITVGSILAVQILGLLPGAWLGTIVGFLALAVRRRNPAIAVTTVGLLLAVSLVPGVFRETAVSMLDPSSPTNAERIRVVRNGLTLFAEDPLTGWGLHDLADDYARVKSAGDPIQGHMVAVPVQVAASMGLPGIAALAWILVALFRELSAARRRVRDDAFLLAVVDGAEAGLVAFLATGLVEWNLGDSEILALLFFLQGTAIAAGAVAAWDAKPEPRPGV